MWPLKSSECPILVWDFGSYNVEYVKDRPYLRVGDKVYDIDYEYAVAKLESGALWRVAMSMTKNRRLEYFGFWGEVFEGYVNWIFETYSDKGKIHSPLQAPDVACSC
jgi:hypothetical protein